MHRHSHEPLLERVWQLRHDVTANDAAYLALAEGLSAILLTRDARLQRTLSQGNSGHRVKHAGKIISRLAMRI